jgi:hypothetical protein
VPLIPSSNPQSDFFATTRQHTVQEALFRYNVIKALSERLDKSSHDPNNSSATATFVPLMQAAATIASHNTAVQNAMTQLSFIPITSKYIDEYHAAATTPQASSPATSVSPQVSKAAKKGANTEPAPLPPQRGPSALVLETALRIQTSLCVGCSQAATLVSKKKMQAYLSLLSHPQEHMILRGILLLAALVQHADARAGLLQVCVAQALVPLHTACLRPCKRDW